MLRRCPKYWNTGINTYTHTHIVFYQSVHKLNERIDVTYGSCTTTSMARNGFCSVKNSACRANAVHIWIDGEMHDRDAKQVLCCNILMQVKSLETILSTRRPQEELEAGL